jgi:hypothetical protein
LILITVSFDVQKPFNFMLTSPICPNSPICQFLLLFLGLLEYYSENNDLCLYLSELPPFFPVVVSVFQVLH